MSAPPENAKLHLVAKMFSDLGSPDTDPDILSYVQGMYGLKTNATSPAYPPTCLSLPTHRSIHTPTHT